jgi:hypothetical protein
LCELPLLSEVRPKPCMTLLVGEHANNT